MSGLSTGVVRYKHFALARPAFEPLPTPGSVGVVHPIERLRHVARGGWGDPALLAAEAAWALSELLLDDPRAAVPASRRLLERHPASGPMWWVLARVLSARDPATEADACGYELHDDPTAEVLDSVLRHSVRAIRHGGVGEVASAEVVVVEVAAISGGGMVVDGDDLGLLEAARALEVPIWAVAGVGRVLPPRLFDALQRRVATSGDACVAHVVELRGVERVVVPEGSLPVGDALRVVDCPEPPELLALD
jgi:hypothetical protein